MSVHEDEPVTVYREYEFSSLASGVAIIYYYYYYYYFIIIVFVVSGLIPVGTSFVILNTF